MAKLLTVSILDTTIATIDDCAAKLSAACGRNVSRSEVVRLACDVASLHRMATLAKSSHVERRGRKRKHAGV